MSKCIKYIIFLLIASLILTSCKGKDSSQNEMTMNIKEIKKLEGKVIIDCSGRKVKIPKASEIKRVVITSPPIVTMMQTLLKSSDKIIGINPLTLINANNILLKKCIPNINEIDTDYIKGFTIDNEKLLKLKPDLIFCYGEQQMKNLRNFNIPVINFYHPNEKDVSVIVEEWEKIICEIFEIKDNRKISKEIEQMKKQKKKINNKSKKALFIFNNRSNKIVVSGSESYGNYWLNFAGLKNVAKNLKGEKSVDMEQIYEWNPEVIYLFMGPGSKHYKKSISGQDWSRISAVQNNKIYDVPIGVFQWGAPSVDSPLMMKWMLKNDYVNQEMKKDIKNYYQNIHQIVLDEKLVNSILELQKDVKKK